MLFRKLLRELRRQWASALAVGVVNFLGVMLFVASYAGYSNLTRSYADTRHKLELAGYTAPVTALSEAELTRLRQNKALARADAREVIPVPLTAADPEKGGRARLEARVISLPDGREPALDRLLYQSGRAPRAPGEVVAERHLADRFHLEPGSTLAVPWLDGSIALKVVGVAVSAEYLWVARGPEDLMPSADEFGVLWMEREGVRRLAKDLLAPMAAAPATDSSQTPTLLQWESAASDAAGNELLYDLAPGVSSGEGEQAITRVIGGERLGRPVAEADLPGVKLLQLDVDGYREMALFFPLFFLGVGCFIVMALVSRMVEAQRAIVGTLVALGVEPGRIMRHYLAYALLLGGPGSVLGAICGLLAGGEMTHAYAEELGIPYVTVVFDPALPAIGLGLGLLAAALSGIFPARRASRLAPAEAMRGDGSSRSGSERLLRHLPRGWPLTVKTALRNVLRHPWRSLATALGVAVALVLVLTTTGMLESTRVMIDVLFTQHSRYDLRADLGFPEARGTLLERAKAIPGVEKAETFLSLPVTLRYAGQAGDALLEALPDDSSLELPVEADGKRVPLRAGGLVLSRELAGKLGAGVGDTVEVVPRGMNQTLKARIDALSDIAFGSSGTMRLSDVQEGLELKGVANTVAMTVTPEARDAVRRAFAAWPTAARVQDLSVMREKAEALMGLTWLMLGVMLVFSVVLAAAILFNTANMGVLEREKELATMRAMGEGMRGITFSLTLQHAVIAVMGLIFGLPLAAFTTVAFLRSFESELFTMPFVWSGMDVAVSAVGVLLVLLVSQWPGLRHVARLNLAEAVRARG